MNRRKTTGSFLWCLIRRTSATSRSCSKVQRTTTLSTNSGYSELYRAMTNQPRLEKQPLGPILRRLPDLDSGESKVMALLSLCPDPLPLEVVSRVVGQGVTEAATTLQRLVQIAVLRIEEHVVRLEARSAEGIPVPSDNLAGLALEAVLDFVKNHRNAAGRAQMMNVVTLAKTADIDVAAAQVSRTFRAIQSSLKSFGDKRLLLEVARRSIEASKASRRGPRTGKGRGRCSNLRRLLGLPTDWTLV